MEMDEMKHVWSRMNQLLENLERQTGQLRLRGELGRIRTGLRPLFWGQILQILFGVAIILLAVGYWSANWQVWYRLVIGIILHVYGVSVIMMAGMTLGRIQGIDYSESVVSIRRQIAKLKSTCVLNGMICGLPWWILWILVVVVLAGYGGKDLVAAQPMWVALSVVAGVFGLLATWAFHRWSHQPARAGLGKRLDDNAAGASLKRVCGILEELQQFESETSDTAL
jgi:hypothetical protein